MPAVQCSPTWYSTILDKRMIATHTKWSPLVSPLPNKSESLHPTLHISRWVDLGLHGSSGTLGGLRNY